MIDKLVPREFKSDQDVRLTPPTVFIDALNITLDTDDGGNSGVVKPIKGTSFVTDNTNIDYTSETNFDVVGSCRDNENRRTYLFVRCDDASKNAILRFGDDTNGLSTVVKGSWLEFTARSHVSADVINGDFRGTGNANSLLFWTDGITPPRKINLNHLDLFDSVGTAGKKRLSYVIKKAPLDPPVASLMREDSINLSNFSTGSFQFAMQYIYLDGEVTSLSPYSKYLYAKQRMSPGSLFTYDNVCKIVIPETSFPEDLKRVRILYREDNGAEVSPFRILDEIDPRDNLTRDISGDPYTVYDKESKTYTFFNNGYAGVLSSEEEDRPYQHIPKLAKCQSIANGRLIYANYVEGFGNLADAEGKFGDNGEKANVRFQVNFSDVPALESTSSDVSALWEAASPAGTSVKTLDYVPLYNAFPANFAAGTTISIKASRYNNAAFKTGDLATGSGEERVFTEIEWTDDDDVLKQDTCDFDHFPMASPAINVSVDIPSDCNQATAIDLINEKLSLVSSQGQAGGGLTSDLTTATYGAYIGANATTVPIAYVDGTQLRVKFKQEVTHVINIVDDGEIYDGFNVDWDGGNALFNTVKVDNFYYNQMEGSVTISAQPGLNGFTSGSSHSLAFAYIDEFGRYGSAQEVGSFYVPPTGHPDRKVGSTWQNGPAYVTVTPHHEAPEWASRFAVLYAGPDDVEKQWDLFIDDATALYRTTNAFPKLKEDSVFVNINTFIEEQKIQGIDFLSEYIFEPGDKLRIISKRDTVRSEYYTVGDGHGSPPFNPDFDNPAPHTLQATKTFWGEFDDDEVPFGDQEDVVEFEVLGITEISKNTDILQYPFGSGPDGEPIPGTYLELAVPRDAYGWGSYNFQVITAGRTYDIQRTLDNGDTVRFAQQAIPNNSPYASSYDEVYPEFWSAVSSYAYGNNPSPNETYEPPYASPWYNRDDGRLAWTRYGSDYQHWKEWHIDLDDSLQGDGTSVSNDQRTKQLHRYSFWDKGVRAMLIKPKDRKAAKVYHEVGLVRSPITKGVDTHGGAFIFADGYSWYRSTSKYDVHSNISEAQVLFGTSGGDDYGAPTAGGENAESINTAFPPERKDIVNTTFGGLVRPTPNEPNPMVESFSTFPGQPDQVRNIGRLNVVSKTGERERCYSMIHSGFYGSETLRLTLSDFDSFNFKDMDVNNGCIHTISPDDQHLLTLQSSKVSRVPLSRSILATAGGDNNLTASNTVLGPEMSFTGDYGLQGGIRNSINIDGTIYFIDKSNRSIIKISPKGFSPINIVDVSEAIEDAFDATADSNDPYSIGYDRERRYVFFTFPGHGTFGYDHIKGVWVGRYSFQPVYYAFNEDDMLSFKKISEVTDGEGVVTTPYGICHKHDAESDGNLSKFYGTERSMSLSMVSTAKQPSSVKTYNAIGIEGGRPESVVLSNDSQEVTIDGSKFSQKENRFYTEIPYDDSNLTEVRIDLTNTSGDATFKGNIVPIGVIDNINGGRFNLKGPIQVPMPINQNATLAVYYTNPVNSWVSILSNYNEAEPTLEDGFIAASNITGFGVDASGEHYVESSGFFSNASYSTGAGSYTDLILAYVTTTPADVSDTTWSGTTISQPYGGKKIRDYYSKIDVTYPADGLTRELYAVSVDVDESKLHM